MPPKSQKPQKSEDMLLRVILVAEILAKIQHETAIETLVIKPSHQTDVGEICVQKTQL